MNRALLLAIAAISTASVQAAPVAGTATLAAEAAAARVVGETGAWTCTGTTCNGPADTNIGIAVAACTAIADKAGRVAAFTAGGTSFAETELARCNRHVK